MIVLHPTASSTDPTTLIVLALAGLGSAIVIGLALAAFFRRRSRPYLLILLALATILLRTAVPGFETVHMISPTEHHLIEHALDVVMTALVIAAVVNARTSVPELDTEPQEAMDD